MGSISEYGERQERLEAATGIRAGWAIVGSGAVLVAASTALSSVGGYQLVMHGASASVAWFLGSAVCWLMFRDDNKNHRLHVLEKAVVRLTRP